MANILPFLRNTSGTLNAQVLYPFFRTVSFSTDVITMGNAYEKRMPERAPFFNFELSMQSLETNDRNAWINTFSAYKGRGAVDIELSLGSTVYDNLASNEDTLSQINTSSFSFSQKLSLRQTQNATWTPPTPIAIYPKLQFGTGADVSVAEYPFTQQYRFLTFSNDNPYGPRYFESLYGAGLLIFPTNFLRAWILEYPLLNQSDMDLVEGMFLASQGRLYTFSFPDPVDNFVYDHVRFNMDDLKIQYNLFGQYSTTVTLIQIHE